MNITVDARHVTYNDEIKKFANDSIENAFGDLRVKISSINMTLELQKAQTKATIVVNIKSNQITSSVESREDINSAITGAIEKALIQTRKYLDKKQSHRPGKEGGVIEQD